MPVKYRKVTRTVIGGEHKGEKRVYAVAKASYACDLPRICELISARTAMSSSEVKGIIDAFLWVSNLELKNGATLRFADWGSFRYVLRSEGTETEKEFQANHIRGAKIVFTPGPTLRETTKSLHFEYEAPFEKEVPGEPEECPLPHIE
ncbi:MAG: hypothetical protein LUE98_16070 [Tannerellaceae bacterium]|nr:hypothetical protein [Tannerellaceae bacterium]MCD8178833.1 hypothetical protein [Tannerellaceae bacterium]